MGFYDEVDLSEFKLLSKIKCDPSCADPCPEFINAIKEKKQSLEKIKVAEVGIGFGATTLLTSLILSENDEYFGFDFFTRTELLAEDLGKIPIIKCKMYFFGNTGRYWDSYAWTLSNLALDMHEKNSDGLFDVAYLDGSHVFFQDGLALCLLKQLVKPTGYLILDDVFIKVTDFVKDEEFLNSYMNREQIEDIQVLRAQKIFLDHDSNFEKLSEPNAWRSVFRRIR